MQNPIIDALHTLIAETHSGKNPFVIDTEGKAEWAIGILASIDDEIARSEFQHKKRMEELLADRNKAEGFFTPLLRAWGKGEKVKRRRQNVTLENGTLSFKAHGEEFVITSLEDATTTARAVLPTAFTTKNETVTTETFDKGAYLAYTREQFQNEEGKLPAGVDRKPEGEAFKVATPKWTPLPLPNRHPMPRRNVNPPGRPFFRYNSLFVPAG